MIPWTVTDEFNKRLGKINDQYDKDIEIADDKQSVALGDLFIWFDRHYDGTYDTTWPKEVR